MKSHVRFLTFRRFENLQPWLPWAACSAALLFGTPVDGQTRLPVPGTPLATQPTVPAEIQPGHPATGNAAPGTPREPAPSPQTAFPSPQREGKQTGVIHPPPVGDAGISKLSPSSDSTMPIVPPPGSPRGGQNIVPK
jgi:hypothetical protein